MKENQSISWLYRAVGFGLSYRTVLIFVLLSLTATVTEIFGIGIFLPIFQFIRLEGNVDALIADSSLWQYAISAFDYINIRPSLIVLLILSFIFFLTRQIFTYARLIYNTGIRQRITQMLRERIFNKYIDAGTSYHDSTPVGNLVNVITTEVNGAIVGIMAPMELIVLIIMLFGYLALLSLLSWQMTLLSIVALLLASKVPSKWIKKSAHTGRKLVDANTSMSEFLVGRLRSPRLVRLSGTEVAEKNEFHELTQEQREYSVLGAVLQARTEVSMEPVVIGLSLFLLYFSYTMLHFQIEVIGLYLVIALRLLPIVKSIVKQWQRIQKFLGCIEVIEDRLKEMQNFAEVDLGVKSITQLKESLVMHNVSYRYPGSNIDALKNVNVKFKANKMIAIVGPSGSGKSTLIDLLPRLRLPTKGLIQIDNIGIDTYTLGSLRGIISYAPQSPQIFHGTVKNHILYGRRDATNKEIQEAAYLAGAKDFIDQLPQGFDTVVGEDAVKISGGQRQRLDIARALVRKASILILDEPTSNLDAESEELFRQVLCRIRQETNTTIIIVAHRLASISDSDNIIVMNQGAIEACDTHSELLSQNGWYSKAWKSQEISI